MILESRPAEAHESMGTQYSEDSAVFYLEMLFRIVVQNRDRILTFWNSGIVLEQIKSCKAVANFEFLKTFFERKQS